MEGRTNNQAQGSLAEVFDRSSGRAPIVTPEQAEKSVLVSSILVRYSDPVTFEGVLRQQRSNYTPTGQE